VTLLHGRVKQLMKVKGVELVKIRWAQAKQAISLPALRSKIPG
jgi:hypothetical protein